MITGVYGFLVAKRAADFDIMALGMTAFFDFMIALVVFEGLK